LRGRFTLAATSVLELQQFKSTATFDMPNANGHGTEVYAEALIWKIS
jgi:hypothetical protein